MPHEMYMKFMFHRPLIKFHWTPATQQPALRVATFQPAQSGWVGAAGIAVSE